MCYLAKLMKFPVTFLLILLTNPLSHFPAQCDSGESFLRIVGGRTCDIADYPFLVQVVSRTSKREILFCGGSLLTLQWVMTAAHCFREKSDSEILDTEVLAGTSKSYYYHKSIQYEQEEKGKDKATHDGNEDSSQTTKGLHKFESRFSAKIILHPEYDHNSKGILALRYDIALIKLDSAFPSDNPHIKVAKLPQDGRFTSDAREVTAVGWGLRDATDVPKGIKELFPEFFRYKKFFNTNQPDDLQCVTLPLISFHECKKRFPTQFEVNDYILCSSSPKGRDTCQGDSGGPVIYNGTVIGVVSLGLGCAHPKYAAVYTRVDGYFAFLKLNTKLDLPDLEPPVQHEGGGDEDRSNKEFYFESHGVKISHSSSLVLVLIVVTVVVYCRKFN